MFILVAYDVCTETKEGRRRLRRVAKICEDYGQRVQKSVFECTVDGIHFEEMSRRLVLEINQNEDNLRVYKLPDSKGRCLKEYGTFKSLDFDGPLIL